MDKETGTLTATPKPNAWKYATTKEITTYEKTQCETFELSDYVVVEMYAEPGLPTKKVQVLGFLDMNLKPITVVFARGILDRNFIYAKFDPKTGDNYITEERTPYIWTCSRKFNLTYAMCQNIPHFHIVKGFGDCERT